MGSLYETVYSAQQNNSGKRAVGYTVGAYAGVLSALQKADMIIVQEQGDSLYSGEYIPTNNDVVVNGFFQNGDKQAQVTFKTYMTFVANVKQGDGSNSAEVVSIEQNISDHDGLAIMGGSNIQYPPSRFTKEALESCKLGCQSYGGFVIGAGVSFDQFVINFFKQFYGTMNWEEGKIEKIAAQGGLYVELMFPGAAGGNTARVIHTKVTVKVTKAIAPNGYDVYFPSALMLLNNYKGLGEIEVTVADSKSGTKDYKVDGTNVSFPYSGGSYNKKTGIINGYKPESVEQAVVSDQTIIATYKGSTLTGKTGRARFYFSKDFEQQVITEFGEIPAEYKDDLFRGVLSGDGNFEIQNDIIEASGFVSGDVYFDPAAFAGLDISQAQYEKCVRIVWDFEVGTPNADWKKCEVLKDGAGISYGPYQYTEKSGLLSKLLHNYLAAKNGNLNELDKKLQEHPISSGTYSGKTKYASDSALKSLLREIGSDPIMKQESGKLFLNTRAKPAITQMRATGMTSALALQMWCYYINHGWNQKKYRAAVNSVTGEGAKCMALANAHLSRLQGLKTWSLYAKGWTAFIDAHKRAINSNNFDLSKVQKWRAHTF